jgi:hypothetical protein
MLVPEPFTQEQAKCNAALLVNKFSDFRRSLVQTVDLGSQFLATADRLFLANSQNTFS